MGWWCVAHSVTLMWPSWHALKWDLLRIDGDWATWHTWSGLIWGVEDCLLLFHDVHSWIQQWPILCSLLETLSWPGDNCSAASCSSNLHVREVNYTVYHCLFLFCNAKPLLILYTVEWLFSSAAELLKGSLAERWSDWTNWWLLYLCNWNLWYENESAISTIIFILLQIKVG